MYTQVILGIFFVFNAFGKVIELTDKNYQKELESRKRMYVVFYSPGCGHCKRYLPTHADASERKEIAESGVTFAKVDCSSAGSKTCRDEEVKGYPTIKYIEYQNGKRHVEEYVGSRELGDIAKFVTEQSQPFIKEISEDKIDEFLNSELSQIVLVFANSGTSTLLKEVNNLPRAFKNYYKFGYTYSKGVAEKLGHEMETLTIFRQTQHRTPLDTEKLVLANPKEVEKFLDDHKHSLVELRHPGNENQFDSVDLFVVYTYIDPALKKSKYRQLRNRIYKVAKSFPNFQFAISEVQHYKQFIEDIYPNGFENDNLHIVAVSKDADRFVCDMPASLTDLSNLEVTLSKFVENQQKGLYKPFIKSQPPPTEDSGPVKLVVASTFDSIVNDVEKDVLILFYAPWCGHCKKLEPIYEDAAKRLESHTNLVLAKMDATANEIPKGFKVEGFPTVYLVKANEKSKPIVYDGDRTTLGIIQWLKKHTSFPVEYDETLLEGKEEL